MRTISDMNEKEQLELVAFLEKFMDLVLKNERTLGTDFRQLTLIETMRSMDVNERRLLLKSK